MATAPSGPPGPNISRMMSPPLGACLKTLMRPVTTTKKKAKVNFTFSSDAPGATFECRLDKGAFAPCTSPKAYKVKPGNHTFSVEAVGAGGTDASPATFSFKVKKKK